MSTNSRKRSIYESIIMKFLRQLWLLLLDDGNLQFNTWFFDGYWLPPWSPFSTSFVNITFYMKENYKYRRIDLTAEGHEEVKIMFQWTFAFLFIWIANMSSYSGDQSLWAGHINKIQEQKWINFFWPIDNKFNTIL